MGRPCSVCRDPRRAEIDLELVSGTPRLAVARASGLSDGAIRRHAAHHLPARLIESERQDEVAEGRRLRDRLARVIGRLEKVCEKAESAPLLWSKEASESLARAIELNAVAVGAIDFDLPALDFDSASSPSAR